jgi:hypothetical protein
MGIGDPPHAHVFGNMHGLNGPILSIELSSSLETPFPRETTIWAKIN